MSHLEYQDYHTSKHETTAYKSQDV